MPSTMLARFRALRTPVRSLVYLFWIYAFSGSLLSAFTQIFLYQRFVDVRLNIIATMLFFTGIVVGFFVVGLVAGWRSLNIKHGFLASFVVIGVSVLYLLYSSGETAAYIAMFAEGIGQGLFWLTIHTFELSETRDDERDFYSSLLTAGDRVFALVGPAVATALIWLSGSYLGWGEFTLLFTMAPLSYLFGLFCFSGVREYRPRLVVWADAWHFIVDRRNRAAQLYLLGSSMEHILATIVPPLIALLILGGPLMVGAYNTVFAVLAIASVLLIADHRTNENRLIIFAVATALIAFATAVLGFVLTLPALIFFTAVLAIVGPVRRVSEHVIDLETMESVGRPGVDFYPTMLMREISLWAWRMLAGFVLLFAVETWGTGSVFLSTGMYLTAGIMLITYLGAHLLLAAFARERVSA